MIGELDRNPADRQKGREKQTARELKAGGGEDGTAEKERHKINLRKGTVEATTVE